MLRTRYEKIPDILDSESEPAEDTKTSRREPKERPATKKRFEFVESAVQEASLTCRQTRATRRQWLPRRTLPTYYSDRVFEEILGQNRRR
jgi:hypothetical protein